MAKIFPFRALTPHPIAAEQVAAPPYDVVDRQQAHAIAMNGPQSFLRVSRAEVELPATVDPFSDAVYRKAAENLARLRRNAPLIQDAAEWIYIYSLTVDGRRQDGIAAALSVDDYDQGVIKQHEKTRQPKVDDRAKHILATNCHSGLLLLAYRDQPEVTAVVEEVTTSEAPIFDFEADDGVQHQVWRVPQRHGVGLCDSFARIDSLYVADGHHRAKSASQVCAQCRELNPSHRGDEAYTRFPGVVFPASQLRVLPYNRTVSDLNGLSSGAFLAALADGFEVTDCGPVEPAGPGLFHLYLAGRWHCLRARAAAAASAIEQLDVSRLQDLLLRPILSLDDPRQDERLDFVGGIHGLARLEELVDGGAAAAAFAMFPTSMDELLSISDGGQTMPPKSTWFEPKLRDGLLLHCFDTSENG